MENQTTEKTAATDDEILAAFEDESKRRAQEAADAIKANDVAAIKELTRLRAASPGVDMVIIGDSTGGAFRGVFRTPDPEIWKGFQAEVRSEHQRPNAGRNLVVRCLKWPALDVLEDAAKRRPALFNVISGALAVEAGSGVDAHVKR